MPNIKVPDPKKINDPQKVLSIMENAKSHGNQKLYQECLIRHCELKAAENETDSDFIKQYNKFLCAYELALTEKNGRRTYARRFRNAVDNRTRENDGNLEQGIIAWLTELVGRKGTTEGFQFLMSANLQTLTAEHLVSSNPNYFSEKAVAAALEKLNSWVPSTVNNEIEQK